MTRLNLVKYRFVRWPEKDFGDDGNRFTCYRAGKKVRVSKLVSNGEVYLSINTAVGNETLPYDVYSKLPHYKDANWKYNGVSLESLTDEDIQKFYEACVAYEKEYEEAEANIKYPTLEELQDKAVKVTAKSLLELSKVESLMAKYCMEAAAKFSPYEWKTIQEYTKNLMDDVKRFDPETFPQQILGKASSFDFIESESYMKESYWFSHLKELFTKYCMTLA